MWRILLSQVCVYFCTSDGCRVMSWQLFVIDFFLAFFVADVVRVVGIDGPCVGIIDDDVFLFLLADVCRNY
jgi:hypothetical protein